MRAILKYLRIVLVHKYWVLYYSLKLGIPWLGLIHDLSKFHPTELFRYAKRWVTPQGDKWDGPQPSLEIEEQFKWAWLHHQQNNKHHWNYWVLYISTPGFDGYPFSEAAICLPIPSRYRREMLADWLAMGRKASPARDWYLENKDKILLHPETRTWVEEQLDNSG